MVPTPEHIEYVSISERAVRVEVDKANEVLDCYEALAAEVNFLDCEALVLKSSDGS
jgi:transcriptional regulator